MQNENQALLCHPPHIHSKSSYSSSYISPLPFPPFNKPTPTLLRSRCHASPHPPHSVYPKDCTIPHCVFYLSATLRTSISSSSASFSPCWTHLLPYVIITKIKMRKHLTPSMTGVGTRPPNPTAQQRVDPMSVVGDSLFESDRRISYSQYFCDESGSLKFKIYLLAEQLSRECISGLSRHLEISDSRLHRPMLKPLEYFWKNQIILEASICDLLMVGSMLGVDPTQSYGKIQEALSKIFRDFAIKTY